MGKGRLDAFIGVLGGVCFKCHGSGRVAGSPPSPRQSWIVKLVRRSSGELVHIYNFNARSTLDALRKAGRAYANGSTDFRDEYTTVGAVAEPKS